jgi:hypothetical protein
MRHATDDHVVAIATIVSRERHTQFGADQRRLGIGHTIMVMAVGIAIIAGGVIIPPRLGSMEFAVGVMRFCSGSSR